MNLNDLPLYIRKHASKRNKDIIIVLPYGYLITEQDVKELPKATKWIKAHDGYYDPYGYWIIPSKKLPIPTICAACGKHFKKGEKYVWNVYGTKAYHITC